jgi:hypothetical protein
MRLPIAYIPYSLDMFLGTILEVPTEHIDTVHHDHKALGDN